MNPSIPTLSAAKAEARTLREERQQAGETIGHGQALERVAKRYGFRDWNTLHAAIVDNPPPGFLPGGRVRGRYFGQPFEATVLAVQQPRPGWYQLELQLDEAVDVVTFDSFSNFRRRVRGTVGPEGMSRERNSRGVPHLAVEL